MSNGLISTCVTFASAAVIATGSNVALAQNERSSTENAYHLMELSVPASEVSPKDFKAKTEAIRSCADAASLSEELGAKRKQNRFVRASQLPPALLSQIEQLPTGRATRVYSNGDQVLRVLVLCAHA